MDDTYYNQNSLRLARCPGPHQFKLNCPYTDRCEVCGGVVLRPWVEAYNQGLEHGRTAPQHCPGCEAENTLEPNGSGGVRCVACD